uniref:hypothetical protein n=1 Tax=Candidatus Electronema sp. TaxID=2698783 RepID=UPI004056FB14
MLIQLSTGLGGIAKAMTKSLIIPSLAKKEPDEKPRCCFPAWPLPEPTTGCKASWASPAEALHQTRLQFIRDKKPVQDWAPFVLVGK